MMAMMTIIITIMIKIMIRKMVKLSVLSGRKTPPHLVLRILNPESRYGAPSPLVYIQCKKDLRLQMILRNIWKVPIPS